MTKGWVFFGLFLQKDQQNCQAFNQTKEKKIPITKLRYENGDITTNSTDKKDYKRILWTIIYQ